MKKQNIIYFALGFIFAELISLAILQRNIRLTNTYKN
jgi:mannose/fructose/N-acetylgalactosamine-specific phosphotransferase system component IIC